MIVHLEPLAHPSYQVRAIEDGGEIYKTCPIWTATATQVEPGVAKIVGAMRAPSIEAWRALEDSLREAGFDTMTFDRCRYNGVEIHSFDLHR